jgi:hypothetical protein
MAKKILLGLLTFMFMSPLLVFSADSPAIEQFASDPCVWGPNLDVDACNRKGGPSGASASQASQVPAWNAQDVITGKQPGGTAGNTQGFTSNTKLQNPIKYNDFGEFAKAVTKTAVEILLPFLVLAFIWSGFLFVRAQGNVEDLKQAKNVLWYSIIGAFILLGSWGFAQIIGKTVATVTQ